MRRARGRDMGHGLLGLVGRFFFPSFFFGFLVGFSSFSFLGFSLLPSVLRFLLAPF
jgi:hypothetical protein